MQRGLPCLHRRLFQRVGPPMELEGQCLSCSDHASCNDVATHDATEDVDKDSLDVWIFEDD